jgi:hypothetical protein
VLRELAVVTIFMMSAAALDHNAARCLIDGIADDPSRPDITCAPLAEHLLAGLHGATEAQLVRIMNVRSGDG